MKITRSNDELGRTVLQPQSEDYDAAPPSPPLIVELALSEISEPRLALAETLAFLSSTTGPLYTEAALAPATAEILASESEISNIIPMNIKWKHSDIPYGSMTVLVDENLPDTHEDIFVQQRSKIYRLHLPSTSDVAGSMALLRERWVPVNASLVGSSKDRHGDICRRYLAALLLLSTELEAGTLVVPDSWTVADNWWATYQGLFKTVGLSLIKESYYKEIS